MTPNSMAIASHAMIVITLIFLMVRLVHGYRQRDQLVIDVACLAAAALIIERVYYIAARLIPTDYLDLWKTHPAPEFLSALVAVGLLAVNLALYRSSVPVGVRPATRMLIEGSAFSVCWLALAIWAG